jgi:Adaptin AP4 complex epsilon appendage platform
MTLVDNYRARFFVAFHFISLLPLLLLTLTIFSIPLSMSTLCVLLQGYVNEALANGASEYKAPDDLEDIMTFTADEKDRAHTSELKTGPYAAPDLYGGAVIPDSGVDPLASVGGATPTITEDPNDTAARMKRKARSKGKWTRQGYEHNRSQSDLNTSNNAGSTHQYGSESNTETTNAPSNSNHSYGFAVEDTHSNQAPAQTTQASPARPQTEKERMAAALFAGIGGTSAPSAATPVYSQPAARPQPTPVQPVVAEPAPQPQQPVLDIFAMPAEPAPAAAESVAPAAATSTSAGDDIFDIFAPSQPAVAEPAQSTVTSADAFDPLALAFGAPVAQPAAPAPITKETNLTTPQYAQLWRQTPVEAKLNVPTGQYTQVSQLNELITGLKIQIVQTIGTESICAATYLATNETVLVHARLLNGSLGFSIRSSSANVNQALEQAISSAVRK